MAVARADDTDAPAPVDPPRRRIPMALVTWAFVLLIVLIIVVLLVIKVTRGSTTVAPPPVTAAPTGDVRAVTSIPLAVFDAVGAPAPAGPGPAVLGSQPPLTIGGRTGVVFVGAEFCPYCAAARWALVAALGRFGTFSHLGATTSSADEAFASTPTFSFDGATFHSRYVSLAAVELYGATPSATAPAGYAQLHGPSPLEQALLRRYDTAPFVAGTGTLPFIDVGNRVVLSGDGVGFSPGILDGASIGQIASELSDPSNPVTQAVLGMANELTAAICASTGERPTALCSSSGVIAGARRLGLA